MQAVIIWCHCYPLANTGEGWGLYLAIFIPLGVAFFTYWANATNKERIRKTEVEDKLRSEIVSACNSMLATAIRYNAHNLTHGYYLALYYMATDVKHEKYYFQIAITNSDSCNKDLEEFHKPWDKLTKNLYAIKKYLNKELSQEIERLIFQNTPDYSKNYTDIFTKAKTEFELRDIYVHEYGLIVKYVMEEGCVNLENIRRLVSGVNIPNNNTPSDNKEKNQ